MIRKTGLTMALCVMAGICTLKAAEPTTQQARLFNVDFSADTEGSPPKTADYVANQTATRPTSLVGADSEGLFAVVPNLGELKTKALKFTEKDDSAGQGKVNFELTGHPITSGTIRLEWDSLISEYTAKDTTGAETALSFRLLDSDGNGFLIVTYCGGSPLPDGSLGFINVDGPLSNVSSIENVNPLNRWAPNKVQHFVVDVNLDKSTFSLTVNGVALVTDRKGNTAPKDFGSLSIMDGWAIGARGSGFVAGVSNLKISSN